MSRRLASSPPWAMLGGSVLLMVLIVCRVTIGKRIGLAMLAGYVIYLGGLYRDSM